MSEPGGDRTQEPLLAALEVDVADVSERIERAYPEHGWRGRLGRLTEQPAYERVNLLATYVAVFAEPLLFVCALGSGVPAVEVAGAVAWWVTFLTSVVFAVDTVVNGLARGPRYLLTPAAVINVLAVGGAAVELFGWQLGVANPRVLRVLRTVRTVAKVGLLQRTGARQTVLGGRALGRLTESDTWYALAILLLASLFGSLSSGAWETWLDAAREALVYGGFVMAVRLKSRSTERQIDAVFLRKLSDATSRLVEQMREIPGLEDAEQVLEDQAHEGQSKGVELDEIGTIVSSMGLVVSRLRRFISRRTFLEAKGAVVLPRDRPVALMFTDVEGFSTVSEALDDDIIPVMRAYFTEMAAGVMEHRGDIDKFIGDAVFAFFDDAEEPRRAADAAFDAALEMRRRERALAEDDEAWRALFSRRPEWEVFQRFRTRFGLHFGAVTAGPIGSAERADSTLVGDNVNTAARLEALAKKYGRYVLVSEAFVDQLSPERRSRCHRLDRVTVAGREQSPLDIYTFDLEDLPGEFWARYAEALDAEVAGDWEAAYEGFSAAQRVLEAEGREPDPAAAAMLARIEEANRWWARPLANLTRAAPEVFPAETAEKVEAELEQRTITSPVGWKGHWSHRK